MNSSKFRLISATAILAAAVACTGSKTVTSTTTPTPTTPTPTPTPPTITVSAPNLVGPASGTVAFGWPTFTWNNSAKTNTTNALIYRFDLSTRDDFATVAHTATVSEDRKSTRLNSSHT